MTTMTHRCGPLVTPQLILGVAVLAVGVVFLLNNLGVPLAAQALRYWPAALVIVGALKLFRAGNSPAMFGAIIWLAGGSWLLLNNLGLITLSFWQAVRTFWPIALVAAGVSMVLRTLRRKSGPPALVENKNTLNVTAILGGVTRAIGASDFKGGEINAVLGGVNLDLSKATFQGEVVFDIFAMWGGIELRVPDGWIVDSSQLSVILGGYEDQTRPVSDRGAPRLILRGSVTMSGVEVKTWG
jgi:hypothetical protein